MASSDKAILIMDGRIDNVPDLQRQISEADGAAEFTGDASVVLHAYHVWGIDCLQRLIGDFAIIVFDFVKEQLILARDPGDSRGLFYAFNNGNLIFGSEIDCIRRSSDQAYPYNKNYFRNGLLGEGLGGLTPYKEIHRLPAGCRLVVDRTRRKVSRYWEPFSIKSIRYRNQTDYAEHFLALFEQAIACRLSPQAPTGITLSGGLDSGAVGCVARMLQRIGRAPSLPLTAVSYRFAHPEADEMSYIVANAEQMGVEPTFLDGEGLMGNPRRDPVREAAFYPEPSDNLNLQLLHESALQSARLGARVLLSGHFGDELFAENLGMLRDFLVQGRWRTLGQYLAAWSGPLRLTYPQLLIRSFQAYHSDIPREWLLTPTKAAGAEVPLFARSSRSYAQHLAAEVQLRDYVLPTALFGAEAPGASGIQQRSMPLASKQNVPSTGKDLQLGTFVFTMRRRLGRTRRTRQRPALRSPRPRPSGRANKRPAGS